MSGPKLYLLDIEGTVAPVSLVTEQLFPYARARFGEFLQKHADDPAVRADLALLAEENRAETMRGVPHFVFADELARGNDGIAPAIAYLLWLMDRDRKSTALKGLQGKIWKAGFESGALEGMLFDDVPAALERWAKAARVGIYSSGSVEAQQLLFRYSSFGDLTALIAGYFDTRIGAKRESASYAAIAAAMKVAPGEILFFSDVVAELGAARAAGCGTRLVVRPGNAPVDDAHGHGKIENFDLI